MRATRVFGIGAVLVALIVVAMAPAASAASANDWAKSYCKALDGYKTAISDASDAAVAESSAVGSGDAAATARYVATLRSGLTSSEKAARKAVKALKKSGTPEVKNGKKVQKAALAAHKEAQRALAEGLSALETFDPANPSTATALLTAAGAFSDATHATSRLGFDVLDDAMRADPSFGKAIAKYC